MLYLLFGMFPAKPPLDLTGLSSSNVHMRPGYCHPRGIHLTGKHPAPRCVLLVVETLPHHWQPLLQSASPCEWGVRYPRLPLHIHVDNRGSCLHRPRALCPAAPWWIHHVQHRVLHFQGDRNRYAPQRIGGRCQKRGRMGMMEYPFFDDAWHVVQTAGDQV